jgi:hypothetical protein
MAQGGRRTPQNNRSPVVTRSHSDPNVTLDPTTTSKATSETTPDIPVEPMTLVPQGIDVHEIVRQSILRTQSALSRIRQPGRQLNQSLDFTNLQEQPLDTGLPDNTLGSNTTDPTEALILGAGGSGIPPSPPGSSPPSSREESSDEGSSSFE